MEGPSLVIASEELQPFIGKKLVDVLGNTSVDKDKLCNQKVVDICSWGKHLIFEFPEFVVRIHFLMYGSYRVNSKKDQPVRLSLVFPNGEINFYNCSVKIISCSEHDQIYDWKIDVMSPNWNRKIVLKKLNNLSLETELSDVLLDQSVFAGVGNIIKNEILFNVKQNPETKLGKLSTKEQEQLVAEARSYSLQAYEWKKNFVWKKHWQIMRKSVCPNCGAKVIRKKTGKLSRWSFFCPNCQKYE